MFSGAASAIMGFNVFQETSPSSTQLSYVKSLFRSTQELCDVISVVTYCPIDCTFMLAMEQNTSEYWIPSVKVPGANSWVGNITRDLFQDIFGVNLALNKIIRFNKLSVPSASHFHVSHVVFEVDVNLDLKKKSKKLFGKYKGKLRWCTVDEIIKFFANNTLRSPEVIDYICCIIGETSPITSIPTEYNSVGNFVEIMENVLISGKQTIYEQIIDASGIDLKAQEILYKEFILMTFPAIYLSLEPFSKFLTEIGWPKEDTPHLFRSADLHSRGGISFREFLYFLAAIEPGTTHGGGPAEIRCRYIFRYLDTDNNNLLKREELQNLIVLVRKSKKQSLDPIQIENELNECYKAIGVEKNHVLTMSEFLKALGGLKVRGTSQIFRSPNSIQKHIKEVIDRESKTKIAEVDSDKKVTSTYAKSATYELALHSIKIEKSGSTVSIEPFWNVEKATSVTSKPLTLNKKESNYKFDQESTSNELLKALRYLNEINKKTHCYTKFESFVFKWGKLDPATVAKHLTAVCNEVREIFLKEPRMLDIPSPVYIIGDLHGNFPDLLNYENILWQVGPALCPCNLLFLGDYVDRGVFSFEVVAYLFAYKLQSPHKVFLLRGNHEIKRVQMQWTFEKECKLKFGEKLGLTVFNTFNDVFDTLPLAAIVDETIFCCHGGIPPPWLCPVIGAIGNIPPVLTDPQEQSSLAWDLMWNDPVNSANLTDKVAMELMANEGFASNSKRGTGHVFNVDALEKFLAANRFTLLVRAHEVAQAGFYLQQKGHLVTVFSSSNYCGDTNLAACLLADQEKLRILRFENE